MAKIVQKTINIKTVFQVLTMFKKEFNITPSYSGTLSLLSYFETFVLLFTIMIRVSAFYEIDL